MSLLPATRGVDDDRERERVPQLEVDDGVDDGRVEARGDVTARPRVRQALHDVESAEEGDGVQRGGDLARAAADALDHLALEDLEAFLKPFSSMRAPTTSLKLTISPGSIDHAVEVRGGDVDVARARALVAAAREVRLVRGEHV